MTWINRRPTTSIPFWSSFNEIVRIDVLQMCCAQYRRPPCEQNAECGPTFGAHRQKATNNDVSYGKGGPPSDFHYGEVDPRKDFMRHFKRMFCPIPACRR